MGIVRLRSGVNAAIVVVAAFALTVGLGAAPSSAAVGPPAQPVAAAVAASPTAAPTSWRGYLCSRNRYSLARLRQGSTGYAVVVLQRGLRSLGWYSKRIDGSFGPITARGVRGFQSWAGIVVDGYVGPQTWGALQRYVC